MENSRLLLYVIIVWIRFLLLEEVENASSHRRLSLPREPRSAEAAVRRGQKLTLALSTLTHQLQRVIKHVHRERARQHDLKTGLIALIFFMCAQKLILSLIKLYSRSNFLITSLVTEHEAGKPLGWVHRPALYFHSDALLLNNCVTKYPKNACLLLLYNFPMSNIFFKKFHFDWFPVPYEPRRCAGENERLRNICF